MVARRVLHTLSWSRPWGHRKSAAVSVLTTRDPAATQVRRNLHETGAVVITFEAAYDLAHELDTGVAAADKVAISVENEDIPLARD
jgi:hypothetical protein